MIDDSECKKNNTVSVKLKNISEQDWFSGSAVFEWVLLDDH